MFWGVGFHSQGRPIHHFKADKDRLKYDFEHPNHEALPIVWWHWMNGNVTEHGINLDMDWMHNIGIGGLQAFDAGLSIPQVVAKRLPYMTPGWKQAFAFAARKADRLGLELGIASSPGWSETGGPWVTPSNGMKKYVWSETYITGGKSFNGKLQQPPTVTGLFGNSTAGGILGDQLHDPSTSPKFYADAKVIAFRVKDADLLPNPSVSSSGGYLDVPALSDGDIEKIAIKLPAAQSIGQSSWIQFDYGRPVTIRGITLAVGLSATYYNGLVPETRSGLAPVAFKLEYSDDGLIWRDTGAKLQTGTPQRTASVANVTARYFRFISIKQAPAPEREKVRFMGPQAPVPDFLGIRELKLLGQGVIDSFEEKAGFYNNADYALLPSGTEGSSAALKSTEVLDLTDHMTADGTLNWEVPPGMWEVLRIGYSLTGAHNGPASEEATGLEVDKLNKTAVRNYMDQYLSLYKSASNGRMGEHGLHAMMFDSWEANNSNWTPNILSDFKRLRGYDPAPFLPALAGYVVDNPIKSDAFLWDWRRTIQQLLKENHYDQITEMLHERGMIRYGEAMEELPATVGDGMEMKQSADIPMGAMWQTYSPGQIEGVYFNDIQESASVAHVYGQNITAAESFTGGPPFGSSPWDLKATADAEMLAGVNRFVIHTSTHQPIDKGPGLTLGVGQYFSRNETWADLARPWISYLARSSALLQKGAAVTDVAVFYGQDGPVITAYRDNYPAVPNGYRYDYVNADVILNRLSTDGGRLTTKTGASYALLYFGEHTQYVTLDVLKRVKDLVTQGAILVGKRPIRSPSLSDDPAEVEAILKTLWPSNAAVTTIGKGRVYPSGDVGQALEYEGIAPDFTYVKPKSDSEIMFVHRHFSATDIYFLSNRVDRSETISATFRVKGKVPELWDASSGRATRPTYKLDGDNVRVSVPMDRLGSNFVIFRKTATDAEGGQPNSDFYIDNTLIGPWSVHFQPNRGAPKTAEFPFLLDFRFRPEAGIKYFSGTATYRQNFVVDTETMKHRKDVWINLGDVRDVAEVILNGRRIGVVWKPPYRLPIGQAIKMGRNELEIRSVNLWVNRLIGDVQPGIKQKYTFTSADGRIKPGTAPDAIIRQKAMPYSADAPLRPSGLLGPVTIERNFR